MICFWGVDLLRYLEQKKRFPNCPKKDDKNLVGDCAPDEQVGDKEVDKGDDARGDEPAPKNWIENFGRHKML